MNNIDKLRKPKTLEEKYKVAINALQAIAGRNAELNEWSQSDAYIDIKFVAIKTLKRLDEDITRYVQKVN